MQQCQIFEHWRKAQYYGLEIVSAAMGIQIQHDTTKKLLSVLGIGIKTDL